MAAHVIEMEDGIKVILPDGSEVGAKLGGHDHGSDLAVLKLEKPIAKPAEIFGREKTETAHVG